MARILQFSRKDRRALPVRVLQPVALIHDDGSAATGTAINLSHAGLEMLCSNDSLRRSDPALNTAGAPGIDVHLRLPVDSGLARVDIECRLVQLSAVDTCTFMLELEFLRFHGDSQACLAEFLRKAEDNAIAE